MPYYGQPLNVKESSLISCLAKATELNKEACLAMQEFDSDYLSEPECPGVNPFPSMQELTKSSIQHKFYN